MPPLETSNDTGPAATWICSGVQPESTSVTATFLAPLGAFELVPHPATPSAATAQHTERRGARRDLHRQLTSVVEETEPVVGSSARRPCGQSTYSSIGTT